MKYWVDRVRTPDSSSDPGFAPISFVSPPEFHHLLKQIIAPEDEIISSDEDAVNEWIFLLKSGDVFPVQIIVSTQTTIDNSKFDGMDFPVVYRGHVVFERRFYKKDAHDVAQSTIPIFNLNKYDEEISV